MISVQIQVWFRIVKKPCHSILGCSELICDIPGFKENNITELKNSLTKSQQPIDLLQS